MSTILNPYSGIKFDAMFDDTIGDPDARRLRCVAATKIFYCFYGRNAWHSTWVQKYSTDCMYLTAESAQAHAERKRVQGSVFYVTELPAIELDVGSFRVFITQINTSCPLREYRCKAVKTSAAAGKQLIEGARDQYLDFGASLQGAVLSFNHDSRFWVTRQPSENSVMVLYTAGSVPSEPLRTTPLKAWKSSSVGKYYYLNWARLKANVSGRSVLRIFKQSGFATHSG